MRILLACLNSKYVHTNLALRYLRDAVRPEFPETNLREFTINERVERIAGEIFEAKAEVIGFSCYIWNLTETLALIRRLRPVCPDTRFVLGGPEVSFDAGEFLKEHPEVDGVVYGEGEETFLELLRAWRKKRKPEQVLGLAWRESTPEGLKIRLNSSRPFLPLSENSIPYQEKEDFQGRLVYVETTRGCPFNCQYCLSSTLPGVRYLDPETFRIILKRLLNYGARTIKFVDRTFNVQKKHAFRILDIVREEAQNYPPDEGIRVHCEIAGELLDEEWVNYLKGYPAGLVQFEVGVQSTYRPTLQIIERTQHFERWSGYVRELHRLGTVPLHLDLIAGLPKEDWEHFRLSFNDVYDVQPDMLQLGFLKVLKGSGLREKSQEFGLIFSPDPPYTILQTRDMSHEELLKLHRLEEVLDRYYNSGKFQEVLPEAVLLFPTPFDFYHELAEYWYRQGWFRQSWSGKALFDKLWEFLEASLRQAEQEEPSERTFLSEKRIHSLEKSLRERLRFDYYRWERPVSVPEFLQIPGEEQPEDYPNRKAQIQADERWESQIPKRKQMDRRQWARATAVEYFTKEKWVLFFYQKGRVQVYPLVEGA
ncbi:B12-binding domain-containing radical SAM protein [Desulfitobacterium sp.]|uniref:B12-binding domain-containing radical SAM protein n=1 Tax=Desulfitobacterium sp. TaxID=49981 RepID=UPI002C19DC32|nr:B12-binding domain-containing radical SAM protein [Desulfitobacterium sp.]HVJ47959.1 B12-binding domain-containing radical SAM protein [Desulfitobacterium sp.]